MEVFETALPGVGIRYDFTTEDGDRLGVVVRRDGKRDLAVYDAADPDAARTVIELTASESSTLVELLGGTKVTERIADLRHEVEGLSIEWVTMAAGRGLTEKTIGDGHIRTRTRASVVAVIRGETAFPGPGPEFRFETGDTVLVMGDVQAVQAATDILEG